MFLLPGGIRVLSRANFWDQAANVPRLSPQRLSAHARVASAA
jgi:hypothetical protein